LKNKYTAPHRDVQALVTNVHSYLDIYTKRRHSDRNWMKSQKTGTKWWL